jgi:hypothetical protein
MVLRTDAPEIPEQRIICPGAQPRIQVLGDPYFPTTLVVTQLAVAGKPSTFIKSTLSLLSVRK